MDNRALDRLWKDITNDELFDAYMQDSTPNPLFTVADIQYLKKMGITTEDTEL